MLKRIFLIIIVFAVCYSNVFAIDETLTKTTKNMVKVYIPGTHDEKSIDLGLAQTATVKVYLSTLGDMVDKFMVSLLDMETNVIQESKLSDVDGIVIFRKVPAGSYAAYINTRVKEDGERYSVKVADVFLSKF